MVELSKSRDIPSWLLYLYQIFCTVASAATKTAVSKPCKIAADVCPLRAQHSSTWVAGAQALARRSRAESRTSLSIWGRLLGCAWRRWEASPWRPKGRMGIEHGAAKDVPILAFDQSRLVRHRRRREWTNSTLRQLQRHFSFFARTGCSQRMTSQQAFAFLPPYWISVGKKKKISFARGRARVVVQSDLRSCNVAAINTGGGESGWDLQLTWRGKLCTSKNGDLSFPLVSGSYRRPAIVFPCGTRRSLHLHLIMALFGLRDGVCCACWL